MLYSFTGGPDGGEPYKGVTLDAQGNLIRDGGYRRGRILRGRLRRCVQAHQFGRSLDADRHSLPLPAARRIRAGQSCRVDKQGNVYGTTPTGGKYGMGTLYQIKPNGGKWKFERDPCLHWRRGRRRRIGRQISDRSCREHLLASALWAASNGLGTVYEVSRVNGQMAVHDSVCLQGSTGRRLSYSGLVSTNPGISMGRRTTRERTNWDGLQADRNNGNLDRERSVQLSRAAWTAPAPSAAWSRTRHGNFYGTTSEGGGSCGCGVIFKMTPGASGTGRRASSIGFLATQARDLRTTESSPTAPELLRRDRNGGNANDGAIYEFTP